MPPHQLQEAALERLYTQPAAQPKGEGQIELRQLGKALDRDRQLRRHDRSGDFIRIRIGCRQALDVHAVVVRLAERGAQIVERGRQAGEERREQIADRLL